jgi:MraZ protein
MFFGQYHHSLDSKDRLTVPSRYRQVLGEHLYITKGFEPCLLVLTESGFMSMFHSLEDQTLTDRQARDLRRLVFSNAFQLDIDNAGRVLIPKELRLAVNITSEVVLVGAGNYAEIWSPVEWSNYLLGTDTESIAERFTEFHLSTRNDTSTSTLP